MRIGFILGFLLGAAVASVLSARRAQVPSEEGEAQEEAGPGAPGLVQGARRQFREALAAAQEAAKEKEAEMLREYERATHKRQPR